MKQYENEFHPISEYSRCQTTNGVAAAPYELQHPSFAMSSINNNFQVQNMSYVWSYCYICTFNKLQNYLTQYESRVRSISFMFSISISISISNITWIRWNESNGYKYNIERTISYKTLSSTHIRIKSRKELRRKEISSETIE